MKSALGDVWSGIKGLFGITPNGAGDVDKPAASAPERDIATPWGRAKEAAKAVAKSVKDAAKTAWDIVSESVSRFGMRIFGHAQGGTLQTGAQIWGMNEQGNPEFMFNAGGRDTVVNADILAEAVYNGVVRAISGRQTTQRIEVGVKEGAPAGPRELAQWLLPSLKFALGR